MNASWVAIQRNPRSGAGPRRKILLELIRELRKHGLRPRLFSNRERLDQTLKNEKKREQLLCLVAAGGDGTIGDLINRHPNLPVAILPLGTENLLAKSLGIKRSGRFVADMIAAGKTTEQDLCQLGEQRFAIMASFGFDADVVHRVQARRTGHIKKLSYLQPILESLRKYSHPELRIWVDEQETAITGRLVIVANLSSYAMQLPIVPSAQGNDGQFDIRIFQRGSRFHILRYLYKIIRRKHEQLDDVISLRGSRIRIESNQPVPVQIDGDPAGFTPAEISLLPSALTLFVPP